MSANREERNDAPKEVWPSVHGEGFSHTVVPEAPALKEVEEKGEA